MKMKRCLSILMALFVVCFAVGASQRAIAKEINWPKNVEIYVPAAAGGGTDVMARTVSSQVAEDSGNNLLIVNSMAGNGVVALEKVRNARPDGSTLLFFHTTMAIQSATGFYDYNILDDFTVISVGSMDSDGVYALVVPADSYSTFAELVAYAKKNPEELLLGIQTGGSTHVMAGLITKSAGIDVRFVDAGSDTQKLTTLIGKNIDAALVNVNQARQYVEAGKINVLGVMSKGPNGGRSSLFPDVESFVEQGYKDVYLDTANFVLGPKGMNKDLVLKIHNYFKNAANSEKVEERLGKANMGFHYLEPDEGIKVLEDTIGKINTLVKELGLEV